MAPVDVLHYHPSHSDYSGYLAKPGTVTLFLARRNAQILRDIRAAVSSGDGRDAWIAHRLAAQYRERHMVPLEEAVRRLVSEPVFASLRYSGKTMASSLFADEGLDACVIPMAYNGGYIEEDTFRLVEHHLPDTADGLEAVLVVHAPDLSSAERAALRAVPPDQREWSIGQPSMCYAITAVAIVMAVIAATSACPVIEPDDDVHEAMTEEEIEAIGPTATARKLLAIRRRMLERQ
jgi:hypothetical protein